MKKNKKGFITEFKEFIMRGNVIDMAIGVIIAKAFGEITTSLVNDIFMPFLSYIIGDVDLTNYNITLIPETVVDGVTKEAVVLGLGTLISTIINFIFIALVIFITIKVFTKARELAEKKLLKKQEEEPAPEAPPAPTTEELLTDILAELRNGNK